MKRTWIYGMFFAPLLAVATGCGDQTSTNVATNDEPVTWEDTKGDLHQAAQTTAKYATQQKDKAVAALDQQLQQIEGNVDDLKKRVEKSKGEMKEALQEQMAKIQKHKEQTEEKLARLKDSSGDAWEELKEGTSKAVAELQETVENVQQSFEE